MAFNVSIDSEHQAGASLGFGELLLQLGKEHDREVLTLHKEIARLRELLAGYGCVTPHVSPRRKRQVSPRSTPCSESTREAWQQGGISPTKSGGISPTKSGTPSPRSTTMNWNLEELPEESFLATQIGEFLANQAIFRMMGVNRSRVAAWNEWWKSLKEPDRPNMCGLRDFVDGGRFQVFILFCIFLNTIYIFYTTEADIQEIQSQPEEYNSLDTKKQRLFYEIAFTTVYSIELCLKLFVHRWYLYWHDEWKWNIFDTVLVVFSLFDTIATFVFLEARVDRPNLTFLRALRILRISKIMRMIRAVRWVQELRLMLDCVLNSVFHLFWCVVLILLVLVMFSLLLVQGLTHEMASEYREDAVSFEKSKVAIAGYFDSVPHAMLTLFKATTGGGDWGDFYNIAGDAGGFYEAVFLFYIAFFCIVAWNIVMSTFVEKAFKLAMPDLEEMMIESKRRDLRYSKELCGIISSCIDADQDGYISLEEFREHSNDPSMKAWFQARDFDIKDVELFFRMISSLHSEQLIDVNTFVMGVMRLRGAASNIDVQALHYDLRNMHLKQHHEFKQLSQQLAWCVGNSKPHQTPLHHQTTDQTPLHHQTPQHILENSPQSMEISV